MQNLPETMKAVVAPTPGGPEALVLEQRPVPAPGDGEILVRVHAAGLNRPDLLQRLGKYNPPPGATDILGLEVAGEVVAAGPEATRFSVGDRVAGLVSGGAHAEYCVLPEATAFLVPPSLGFVEAAALPEGLFSVWMGVFEMARLGAGEALLVHGGGSGIGTMAIQLGKAFGATVIVTVGSDEKADACRKLGADAAVNYRTEDFVAVVAATTSGRGADVILDIVGGDYVPRNYEAAADDGRIFQFATLRGASATIDLRKIMRKRLIHTGGTLRSRPAAFKAALAKQLAERVWPLVESGTVRAVVDSTFPLASVAEAHRRMEASAHFGKIVLVTPAGEAPPA